MTAVMSDAPGITVQSSALLPLDAAKNTAARAGQRVLEAIGADCGVHLDIEKGIALGSGIGGSAASAAAGAWAVNMLLGVPLAKHEMVDAVLEGEALASGGEWHGDNVLPALFGGLVLTSPLDPSDYRPVSLLRPLHIALLLPSLTVLTADARDILPARVPFRVAVENASDLAFMIQTLTTGDYETVGVYMMRDRLVEPARSALLPFFEEARAGAMAAGAWAAAITGSGPAMFALAPDGHVARAAADAMVRATAKHGVAAQGVVTTPDFRGVRAA